VEKLSYKILNQAGKEVGKIDLNPEVFDAKASKYLVHDTVRWQRNKARSGQAKALTRAQVSGGGKKPWKQKGTGNARAGSNTSPLWVGGGKAHGPLPRSYEFRLSKRARRQALASVLSFKRREGQLVIVDSFDLKSGKTKDMAKVLKALGVGEAKAILVVSGDKKNTAETMLRRSAHNIPNLTTLELAGVNVYDLMSNKFLVCTQAGIEALQSRVTQTALTK